MSSNLDPIAYAKPERGRSDPRVRRLLGGVTVGLSACMLAANLFVESVRLEMIRSRRIPGETLLELSAVMAAVVSYTAVLIGGAMLLRRDGRAARSLIRSGCGAIVLAVVTLSVVSIASMPSTYTARYRAAEFVTNVARSAGSTATVLAMTFALPPRRRGA